MLLLFNTCNLLLASTTMCTFFSKKPVCNFILLLHTSQTTVFDKIPNKKAEYRLHTHFSNKSHVGASCLQKAAIPTMTL